MEHALLLLLRDAPSARTRASFFSSSARSRAAPTTPSQWPIPSTPDTPDADAREEMLTVGGTEGEVDYAANA